jgi:hypothetical protein
VPLVCESVYEIIKMRPSVEMVKGENRPSQLGDPVIEKVPFPVDHLSCSEQSGIVPKPQTLAEAILSTQKNYSKLALVQ